MSKFARSCLAVVVSIRLRWSVTCFLWLHTAGDAFGLRKSAKKTGVCGSHSWGRSHSSCRAQRCRTQSTSSRQNVSVCWSRFAGGGRFYTSDATFQRRYEETKHLFFPVDAGICTNVGMRACVATLDLFLFMCTLKCARGRICAYVNTDALFIFKPVMLAGRVRAALEKDF